jgi:hypothetical protein
VIPSDAFSSGISAGVDRLNTGGVPSWTVQIVWDSGVPVQIGAGRRVGLALGDAGGSTGIDWPIQSMATEKFKMI